MTLRCRLAIAGFLFPAALIAAFFLGGRERIWSLFGSPDLGSIHFETLARRTTPNDALACPPGICQAQSDVTPPEYAVSAADLRLAVAKAISAEPRLTAVASDDSTMIDRYIQRSALMRFPDTIVVQFFDRPGGRSTLALYSRSQLGHGDMGVNRARLERWLAKLGEIVPVAE
jgi:uncharacterized protein (DUF1499 family)